MGTTTGVINWRIPPSFPPVRLVPQEDASDMPRASATRRHTSAVSFSNITKVTACSAWVAFASDLQRCPTWQEVLETNAENYGKRSVYNYINRQRHELYDLKTDPSETNNLATDPEHQATLQRLQQKLQDFQERTRDPWRSKWEYE